MRIAAMSVWWATALASAPMGGPAYRSEQIPLRHCTAAELMPLLQPIVEGHGRVSESDRHRLLVTSSPPRLTQVRDVVLALDAPPRPLRLSVRQAVVHTLRAFEGFETWIDLRGEPMPDQREAAMLRGGVAVADDWWVEALGAGFAVTPWFASNDLRLRVTTRGHVAGRTTTIAAGPGEWIEIGGILEQHALEYAGVRFEPDRPRRLESAVQVMVETLD